MNIVNYTPHDVSIVRKDGTVRTVPRSGHVIRVIPLEKEKVGEVDGIEFFSRPVLSPLTLDDLPSMEDWGIEDVGVVSMVALEAIRSQFPSLANRFRSPGELVRNEAGQPVGCLGLNL